MIGTTGSYAVNGVAFPLQPSYGKWGGRDSLGVDGNGRTIYPKVRTFEMGWDLMATADLDDLNNAHASSISGTVVVDLPQWGASTYTYYSYSGTYIDDVEVGEYYVGFVSDVRLLVRNIRTN